MMANQRIVRKGLGLDDPSLPFFLLPGSCNTCYSESTVTDNHSMTPKTRYEWLLFVHQLPPKPTGVRVRIWRQLQKLGAIVVKNSLYVLPFNEKTHEDFQWLKRDVEAAGGEATVFRAGSVEGATDDEIVAAFRKARDEDYRRLAAELDALVRSIRERPRNVDSTGGRTRRYESDLEKAQQELARIVETDFFHAAGRAVATAAYERGRKALQSGQGGRGSESAARTELVGMTRYRGRRWVTRRGLFVDRLASMWLVTRFIDAKARFVFVDEGERVENAIAFDMFEGDFTHQGQDCTFETMLKAFGLTHDAGLRALAEIVHDLDLKDGMFNRPEASGLGSVIRGLSQLVNDDRKLAEHCLPIFDGLYELMKRNTTSTRRTANGRKRRARTGARKRSARS